MNIFYIDEHPQIAARGLCDKHCVKMILEGTQLLSTSHRVSDGICQEIIQNNRHKKIWVLSNKLNDNVLYQATHINHPCAIWVRSFSSAYEWLWEHTVSMCNEYSKRYGKIHKCRSILNYLSVIPKNTPNKQYDYVPLAMPDQYKSNNPVKSYRDYYYYDKYMSGIATWKDPQTMPLWIQERVQKHEL